MQIVAELVLVLMWLRMLVSCGLGAWAYRRRSRIRHAPRGVEVPSARVTVVVPAFNEEATIEPTLQALLHQTARPWQIIVVDDGSTDRTLGLARDCLAGRERCEVMALPTNRGKAAALNAGVAAAAAPLVATVDADTRLDADALAVAVTTLTRENADAVALYLEVENRYSWLGQLQRQEYVAALNFERAGQDVIAAISILPGAATLFRREVLLSQPFSSRSRTEDADLTLQLARRGARLVLAADAVARTVAPASIRELQAQRIRWIAGHLQCCGWHAGAPVSTSWYFMTVVFPGFLMSTLLAAIGAIAIFSLVLSGPTSVLAIGWIDATIVSLLLVYAQRGLLRVLEADRQCSWGIYLIEPLLMNALVLVCFVGAVGSMFNTRLARQA